MMINNIAFFNSPITTIFNKECSFCFENINKDEINETDLQDKTFEEYKDICNLKTNVTLLGCYHNFHSECFINYIIHSLIYKDHEYILNCFKIKCPICRHPLNYSCIYDMLTEYNKLLTNDKQKLKQKIKRLSRHLKYLKFIFFCQKIIKKEMYLLHIHNYYKLKGCLNNLIELKANISRSLNIIRDIRLYI